MLEIIKIKNKKATLALTQILILVIATVAFAWIVGASIGLVSGAETGGGNGEDDGSGTTGDEEDYYGGRDENIPEGESGGEIKEFSLDILKRLGEYGTGKAIEKGVKFGLEQIPKEGAKKAGGNLIFGGSNLEIFGVGLNNILGSALGAAAAAGIITLLAGTYAGDRNLADITTVAWVGAGIGTVMGIIAGEAELGPPGWIAAAVTVYYYGVYMLVGYQIYSRETFTYEVGMWQPQKGVNNCDECNKLEIAGENVCSEYICHTYGSACKWTNGDRALCEGDECDWFREGDYEKCIKIELDNIPPRINPLTEAYGENVFPDPNLYSYIPVSTGASIRYKGNNNGCVPAFTPITIAVETNEEAHCKIDIVPHDGQGSSQSTLEEIFDSMMNMAEGSADTKTHTLKLPPIVAASENSLQAAGYGLSTGDVREFYIRCQDMGGVINEIDYSIAFCVDDGPDRFPPNILKTDPPEDSYIPYGQETIPLFRVYTDEPAICKWDTEPRNYEFMRNDFDKCSTGINDPLIRSTGEFGCRGNLTGLVSGEDNSFYIACIDQPELSAEMNDGNDEYENMRKISRPKEIVYKGTKPLVIQDIRVNGLENNSVIETSESEIDALLEVLTYAGAEEGKAKCKYSNDLGEDKSYNYFYNEGSLEFIKKNSVLLHLTQEEDYKNYKYFIECEDVAKNTATTMINFYIEVDQDPPEVIRVYKEGNELVIIINEAGECFYSTTAGCDYGLEDDGVEKLSASSDGLKHTLEWNTESELKIKCADINGIYPISSCNIEVKPFDIPDIQEMGN